MSLFSFECDFFGFFPLNTLSSPSLLILATDDELMKYNSKYLEKIVFCSTVQYLSIVKQQYPISLLPVIAMTLKLIFVGFCEKLTSKHVIEIISPR